MMLCHSGLLPPILQVVRPQNDGQVKARRMDRSTQGEHEVSGVKCKAKRREENLELYPTLQPSSRFLKKNVREINSFVCCAMMKFLQCFDARSYFSNFAHNHPDRQQKLHENSEAVPRQ